MKRVREGKKSSSGPKEKIRKSKNEKQEKREDKKVTKETELNKLKIADIDFDDETLAALPKNCKPIWYFMDNRKEMIDQIFSAIQESSLQKMIPKELKNCNINDLKSMCLEQLMSMSEDYVLYLLAGGDPDSFIEKVADAESNSESKPKDAELQKEKIAGAKKEEREKKSSANVVEKKEEKSVSTSPKEEGPSCEMLTLHPSPVDMESLNEDSVMSLVTQGGGDMGLEMLELVMRAKAIRSLLEDESNSLPGLED